MNDTTTSSELELPRNIGMVIRFESIGTNFRTYLPIQIVV